MQNFNPVIVPVRNNLYLTRRAIKTFRSQDIGNIYILVINNASTDGTNEYLQTERDVAEMYFNPPLSVARSWNLALQFVFSKGAEYSLVVNNDVELRYDTYRHLVHDGGGFVTAVGVRDRSQIDVTEPPPQLSGNKRPHPDFSCYLIRKEVYEKVGPFDENFKMAFCEDWDYHIRLHQAGIEAYSIDLPYLHHGSMTIKNADKIEVRKLQQQADRNRAYFKKKYGFAGGSPEYEAFFRSPFNPD